MSTPTRRRQGGGAPDPEAPQTWRERRWSRRAKADRERRKVRTTGGGRKTRRSIVIQVGGRRRKPRRKLKVRSKKFGVLASVWLIVSALFTICWLTLGGALWFVGALLMGLASVMSAIATFDPDAVVPDKPARRPSKPSPRATGGSGGHGSSSGTRRRKSSPVKPKKRVCSARCQASTKPASTCNCVCQGKTHGSRKLKVVS